jgi:hypothetical protein
MRHSMLPKGVKRKIIGTISGPKRNIYTEVYDDRNRSRANPGSSPTPTRRDARVARCLGRTVRDRGQRARRVLAQAPERTRKRLGLIDRRPSYSAYQNTIRSKRRAVSGRPRDRGARHLDHPLERARDGGAREPSLRRTRRTHRELRVGCGDLRSRFQPFLSRRRRRGAGDLVFFQPHSAPGIYARAFLEGRLDEEQLANFRRELSGNGLSSYPHPWLMPTSGSFRPARWVSGRSRRSITRASCAISNIAASRDRRTGACGACSATARWTSRNRSRADARGARETR